MTLSELEKEVPELADYTETMPAELRRLARVKVHPPGGLIHQKDSELRYLGIVAKGENRVINEFENGKIYMIVYIPRKDAEKWVNSDTHILRKMAERTAFKLYRSSYNNGLKLYYPPMFLVADYLVRLYEQVFPESETASGKSKAPRPITLQKTRERLGEELGMNTKTLDRTIRSMHKDGYFSLVKGKITYGIEEYLRMKEYLSTAKG